jgi:hypothetical protein
MIQFITGILVLLVLVFFVAKRDRRLTKDFEEHNKPIEEE